MRPVPSIADDRLGVFTLAEALSCGWSERDLQYAVKCDRLRRLRRGVYCSERSPEASPAEAVHLGRLGLAVGLTVDGSSLSHAAAVAVHGLPLLDVPDRPCITLPPPFLTQRTAVHLHRQLLPASQLRVLAGVSITDISRSCIDLARENGLAPAWWRRMRRFTGACASPGISNGCTASHAAAGLA